MVDSGGKRGVVCSEARKVEEGVKRMGRGGSEVRLIPTLKVWWGCGGFIAWLSCCFLPSLG